MAKKYRFTLKQDKLAKAIAKGYIKKGLSKKKALSIGYATIAKDREKG